jgi:site-specific recombinase XerD
MRIALEERLKSTSALSWLLYALFSTTVQEKKVILEQYRFHMRARNLSPRTIEAAGDYLKPFLAAYDPFVVTKADLEQYLAAMFERCKPSTVWTAWRHLRSFFGWLRAEGDIETNPMEGVAKPIVPDVEIPCLTNEEIKRLFGACSGTTRSLKRDRALLAVMLDTGIRLSEVARLQIQDLGPNGTIRVFGKGRKWRTVVMGVVAQGAVNRWLRTRESGDGSLWTSSGTPLSPGSVRKTLRRLGQRAGVDFHPHMLRHTFIDNWLRNGGNEVDLARLCGWTTTRMAERYARQRANERAVNAHSSIRPLDKMF